MIVDCPNCAQKYYLPSDALAVPFSQAVHDQSLGWWLSCGYCDCQWWQEYPKSTSLNFPTLVVPEDLEPSNPADFSIQPKIDVNRFAPSPPLYTRRSWMLSFVSALIIALSLGGVGYLYKEPLILFWYQTVGKPILPTIRPLLLQNVSYILRKAPLEGDDSQILTIKGEIVNANTIALSMPALRISIWADCQGTTTETISPAGDCLYLEWMFKPNSTQIDKTSRLPFETSYPISARVRRVEVAIP